MPGLKGALVCHYTQVAVAYLMMAVGTPCDFTLWLCLWQNPTTTTSKTLLIFCIQPSFVSSWQPWQKVLTQTTIKYTTSTTVNISHNNYQNYFFFPESQCTSTVYFQLTDMRYSEQSRSLFYYFMNTHWSGYKIVLDLLKMGPLTLWWNGQVRCDQIFYCWYSFLYIWSRQTGPYAICTDSEYTTITMFLMLKMNLLVVKQRNLYITISLITFLNIST